MTLHDVAAEPVGRADGTLEVDVLTDLQDAEVRPSDGLRDEVAGERLFVPLGDGDARTVDGDRVADLQLSDDLRSTNLQSRAAAAAHEPDDASLVLHDPCEHQTLGLASILTSAPVRRTDVMVSSRASAMFGATRPAMALSPTCPSSFGAM